MSQIATRSSPGGSVARRRGSGRACLLAALSLAAGCEGVPRASLERNDLAKLKTVPIEIVGKATYTAWIADEPRTQQLGLMNVTEADLPVDRAMIFVFPYDRYQSFWMRNTIIPLDIAYIRSDGTIVKTHTMEPLNEMGYSSVEPARFALEVRAGQFAEKGIQAGDHVKIPAELFE